MTNRTIKQYQNNDGIVLFIDEIDNLYTISFVDINGKKIDKNDVRAITFFHSSKNAYLVSEIKGE